MSVTRYAKNGETKDKCDQSGKTLYKINKEHSHDNY